MSSSTTACPHAWRYRDGGSLGDRDGPSALSTNSLVASATSGASVITNSSWRVSSAVLDDISSAWQHDLLGVHPRTGTKGRWEKNEGAEVRPLNGWQGPEVVGRRYLHDHDLHRRPPRILHYLWPPLSNLESRSRRTNTIPSRRWMTAFVRPFASCGLASRAPEGRSRLRPQTRPESQSWPHPA